MNLTNTLLLLFVAALVATVLASELPGAWWQWTLTALILFCAAGVSAANDDA